MASLSHFQGRQKVNTITRALVDTADSPVLWNGSSSCDFGWFFSQALDEMKNDYEQNGDGFRIDKYLAERYQEENEVNHKQEQTAINALKTSPDMHLVSDNQVKKSAGPVHRTATGAVKTPEPGVETSEQATKEHISNQKNATPNELDIGDDKSESASTSAEAVKESQAEQQPISPNPNAVNNEMDMDSPIRNGHAPLVSENKDARQKEMQQRRIRQEQQNRNDLDFGE